MRILIIDDEESIVKSLSQFFERRGYGTKGITASEEALMALVEEPFDVIITDLQMTPVSGFEILRVAREKQPDALRIAMSGKYTRNDVGDLDADHFFEKPFHYKDIEAVLPNATGAGKKS